jgi:hypothetical protein
VCALIERLKQRSLAGPLRYLGAGPAGAFGYDTFTVESDLLGNPRASFVLGPDGEVASLRMVEVMGVDFRKVKSPANRPSKAEDK